MWEKNVKHKLHFILCLNKSTRLKFEEEFSLTYQVQFDIFIMFIWLIVELVLSKIFKKSKSEDSFQFFKFQLKIKHFVFQKML